MKALSKQEKKTGLWIIDAETPKLQRSTDVLIKIHKTAICGTDLHIYNWDQWAQQTIPVPMIVGHEFVGTVCEVGDDVTRLEVGDRVSGEGHLVCGMCRRCRGGQPHLCPNTRGIGVNLPGAFAEYLCMPKSNVFKLPDSVDDDTASIFDPFGNAVHTTLSFDLIGEDVLITGAGPIGIMAVAIARHVGARHIVITDINPHRLELAEKMGATAAINMQGKNDADAQSKALKQVMHQLGMQAGFDVGLEMSGQASCIQAMIELLYCGGKIAALGLTSQPTTLDWNHIVWKGLQLKGIYGREMYETWYKMFALLQSGLNIAPVITHRFPVDDFQKGFELMRSGQCGKVILDWQ